MFSRCLVGELSQLCYKGVLRTIALASTDGLSTWRVGFLMTFQPVIVPVGRIALGRIFNVVGSIIDRYIDLSLSSQFNTTIPIDSGLFIESHENLTYTFSYPNHIFILDTIININLISFWNTMIMNVRRAKLHSDWIFYIAYFYQNLT